MAHTSSKISQSLTPASGNIMFESIDDSIDDSNITPGINNTRSTRTNNIMFESIDDRIDDNNITPGINNTRSTRTTTELTTEWYKQYQEYQNQQYYV